MSSAIHRVTGRERLNQAFCAGQPGWIKSEPALLNRHQSLPACATKSGVI